MRVYLVAIGLVCCSMAAMASDTLRVGNRVLVSGDSTARVTELLGKPSHKARRHEPRVNRRGVQVRTRNTGGELWQYRRGDHWVVVTVVSGKVTNIDEQ